MQMFVCSVFNHFLTFKKKSKIIVFSYMCFCSFFFSTG